MTLTQRKDGEPGASYFELVDLLQSRGANTQADCVELFRRVLFSILIHNTDDHLRNHGFFLQQNGIVLSPAYDINPVPDRTDLTLAINEFETHCDADIAMQAHKEYGLSSKEADRVFDDVRKAVSTWREVATSLRIPKGEQELMSTAFGNNAP